jgi:hypothetical protein
MAAGIALALLLSCGSGAGDLSIPDAGDVNKVQIWGERTLETSDPESVARMLAALSEVSAGWSEPIQGHPPAQYAVNFNAGDNTLLLLWIGDDWGIANGMQGGPNLRGSLVGPQREKRTSSVYPVLIPT